MFLTTLSATVQNSYTPKMTQMPLTHFFNKKPSISNSGSRAGSSVTPAAQSNSSATSPPNSPHPSGPPKPSASNSSRDIRPHESFRGSDARGVKLRKIAEATLEAISTGRYVYDSRGYDLAAKLRAAEKEVVYYAPDDVALSRWKQPPSSGDTFGHTQIMFHEISTLDGAKLLATTNTDDTQPTASPVPLRRIGVLNFASAKHPGGGFLTGAQAQEESIARSSTLYPILMTETGQQFYKVHKKIEKVHRDTGTNGYYTHAMLYSPGVTVFRDDAGGWTTPLDVDIVTSAAVNAGVVRGKGRTPGQDQKTETEIAAEMRERMARVLCLFERHGVKDLVLGSFGTGVFRNSIPVVAGIWAELLVGDSARFKSSFDRVLFAVLGSQTFNEFEGAFKHQEATLGTKKE